MTFYQRALALTTDEVIKTAVIERLLVLFDEPLLNNAREMEATLREFIILKPTELDPLFRLARFQEANGSLDAAEETLLSARRLQPGEIDPLKMLAQFYARRASALYSQDVKNKPAESPTPPGDPDKNGVYQVGLLDDAALKAVREWQFDPTIVNGKAVPIKMTVTVNFTTSR